MGKLSFDTVDGFQAQIGSDGQSKRLARGFTLENIDTSISPYEIAGFVQFYTAAQDVNSVGMTAMGSSHPDPRFPECLQTNIVILGILSDAVKGQVIYTSDASGGFTPTTYVVTRTKQVVQHTETYLPTINGQPGGLIQCDLTNETGDEIIVKSDFVPMNFRRTSPIIVFEGLKIGLPDDSGSDYQGYVNSGTFRGQPTGHWYLDDYTTSYSKYTGYSQFRIAIARNILGRDWSQFGTLFNSMTGKYCEVDPEDVLNAEADGYTYGLIGSTKHLGFTHVGGYPVVDFASIGVPTI